MTEPSTSTVTKIIALRGAIAVERWREVLNIELQSASTSDEAILSADAVVNAEEARGIYAAILDVKKERRALRLVEAIAGLASADKTMTIEDVVCDAQNILKD
jgi:Ni,Fe-hydrogenase III large subunit